MGIVLQIFLVVLSLAFCTYIVLMVKRGKLLLRYSLLWLLLGIVILVCSIFPQPVIALSELLGFDVPANFVFIVGLFFLLAICMSLTRIVSKQSRAIRNLVQQIAIYEHDDEDKS